MRVCVTGGAGFIGSNLVDRLVADGDEVVVLDNLSTGRRENLAAAGDAFRLVEGDLRDADVVAGAVAGCEVVYHQAALAAVAASVEDPHEVTAVNVGGTLNLLVAARDAGVRRVVFASSSAVYGDAPALPKREDMPLAPRSPYAATKAAGEAYLGAFRGSFGLEAVSLRYFNVYGPRQSPRSRYAAVVPLFIEAALAQRPPTIHGDGAQTRDFAFVADVVDAVVRAGRTPGAVDTIVNVGGGGRRVSVRELANIVAAACGWAGEPIHTPPRTGDVRDSVADVARAREVLGWTPATRLEDGIARTVAHLRAAGPPA